MMTIFRPVTFLVLAYCIVCPSAHAGKKLKLPPSGKWNCDGSQMEINFCDRARFEKIDKEMNDVYHSLMDQIEDEAARTRLRDAQQAWVIFRDKSCMYEAGPREESGSKWAADQYSCMQYHTKKRIDDLKSYLKCPDCRTPGQDRNFQIDP